MFRITTASVLTPNLVSRRSLRRLPASRLVFAQMPRGREIIDQTSKQTKKQINKQTNKQQILSGRKTIKTT